MQKLHSVLNISFYFPKRLLHTYFIISPYSLRLTYVVNSGSKRNHKINSDMIRYTISITTTETFIQFLLFSCRKRCLSFLELALLDLLVVAHILVLKPHQMGEWVEDVFRQQGQPELQEFSFHSYYRTSVLPLYQPYNKGSIFSLS